MPPPQFKKKDIANTFETSVVLSTVLPLTPHCR